MDCNCNFRSAPKKVNHSSTNTPVLFFIQKRWRRNREHATFWFEPQACMKSDLVCARWNYSNGHMIPNSRNTTCWSLPEIGRGFTLRLCGPEELKESSTGHYSATGEHVWSQLLTPHTVYILISNTKPHHPCTNGCLFRQWTRTRFHCNLCRGWQWKHHSRVSPSGKLLFSSVNREITSHKHRFGRWNLCVYIVSGFYLCKCLVYEKYTWTRLLTYTLSLTQIESNSAWANQITHFVVVLIYLLQQVDEIYRFFSQALMTNNYTSYWHSNVYCFFPPDQSTHPLRLKQNVMAYF